MSELSHLQALAIDAAEKACATLNQYINDAQITRQDGKDLKTAADIAAEHSILKTLKTSAIPVLSEESSDSHRTSRDGYHWIIDPLDGTVNFTRCFPFYCVSIALWNGDSPILGIIKDIQSGKTYKGLVSEGAYLEDKKIQPSQTSKISDSILATGYPTNRDFSIESLTNFSSFVRQFKKVRMIGSAALSLAYIASGVFDYYCEEDIYLWDVAAGIALAKAGGCDFKISKISSDLRCTVHVSKPGLLNQISTLN